MSTDSLSTETTRDGYVGADGAEVERWTTSAAGPTRVRARSVCSAGCFGASSTFAAMTQFPSAFDELQRRPQPMLEWFREHMGPPA